MRTKQSLDKIKGGIIAFLAGAVLPENLKPSKILLRRRNKGCDSTQSKGEKVLKG